ncbi:hypothetical protein F5883DRAFT_577658 [Diaporthe sp. PMI_573]|nr:hypothetical protein F5883DRAFT_577658 [Diaporthaceae sp. PMI_573]
MVLYDEDNPDADAIGKVSKADLARIPDAVIVAGTSLQASGTIRIAKEMCKATRSIDGITVWLNKEPPPSALRDLWDLKLLCECDDSVAPLDLLPMQFTSQDKDSELNRHAPREMSPVSGRNHYIHSTFGPSRVDVRFFSNYVVDVAHIRPEWNGCTHVDL